MKRFVFGMSVLLTMGLVVGCDNGAPTREGNGDGTTMESGDTHQHPTEGPHHGALIELGNEEYHAELVHDDASVTVYILDGRGTEAVPIDAAELTINLVHDGEPAQFKLLATPETNDSPGKSSRFTLQDANLVQELDHDHATARLSVTIDGKSYRGELDHDHGH